MVEPTVQSDLAQPEETKRPSAESPRRAVR